MTCVVLLVPHPQINSIFKEIIIISNVIYIVDMLEFALVGKDIIYLSGTSGHVGCHYR